MYLRLATLDDIPNMQNLFVDTIRSVSTKDYNADQIDIWTASVFNAVRWLKLITDQYCMLAFDTSNTLIGFGSLIKDYIDFMYVHRDYQGIGVATLILKVLLAEASRQKYLIIYSEVSITARPFFESQGFKAVHENVKMVRGVEIRNFRMEHGLESVKS